jgi:hypothetical protein
MNKIFTISRETMIYDTWTLRACVRAADTVKQLQLPVVYVTFRHVMGEYKKALHWQQIV